MQLLFFPLVRSFHMLVQTHAVGEIPFPIALFLVIHSCEQQALVSEHRPKYLCTCHGNTCRFCLVFHAALFLLCQVFFTRGVVPNTLATDLAIFVWRMLPSC